MENSRRDWSLVAENGWVPRHAASLASTFFFSFFFFISMDFFLYLFLWKILSDGWIIDE